MLSHNIIIAKASSKEQSEGEAKKQRTGGSDSVVWLP